MQHAGRDDRAEPEPEPEPDPESVAHTICLRLLTTSPRSRAELADALRRRNVPEVSAEVVLDRLAAVGLVDDQAFAAAWVQSRHRGRGLARRALAVELRRRGVEAEAVAGAVETLDSDQELQRARDLVLRRLPATEGLPHAARLRRLSGLLARKGYPAGLIRQVVREALVPPKEGPELPAFAPEDQD